MAGTRAASCRRPSGCTLFRPLPPAGTLLLDSEVTAVHDLGTEEGALVLVHSSARSAADEQPLFAVQRGIFARGDGGFGAALGALPPPHAAAGAAGRTCTCELEIRAEQALRLPAQRRSQSDPCRSRSRAPRRPARDRCCQNLCTFGVACRGVLETICDFDPTLITGFEARYTGGVYPGDRLLLELWQDANILSFRASVPARSRTVLDNGRCVLSA